MTELNNEMIQAVLQMIRYNHEAQISSANTIKEPLPTLFDKLELGQQYAATVIKPAVNDQVLLRILNETVHAETTLQLTQGQKISVEVINKGAVIQLQLKTLPTEKEVQTQFIKINLPKQQPLPELLTRLDQFFLKKTVTESMPNLPNRITLESLTRQIIESIPTFEQLKEPALFKKLLAQSGLFLERQLASQNTQGQPNNRTDSTPIQADLKANLLKVAEQLNQAIKQQSKNETRSNSIKSHSQETVRATVSSEKTEIKTSPTRYQEKQQPTTPTAKSPYSSDEKTSEKKAQPLPLNRTFMEEKQMTSSQMSSNKTSSTQQIPISQLKDVLNKGHLSATQSAQRAIMQSKQTTSNDRNTSTQTISNNQIQSVLNLLPKTELHLALKQLMFKKMINAQHGVVKQSFSQHLSPMAELLRSVENGIARIQTQQLSSVPQDETTRQIWQIEIPLRDQKELHALLMRFEQDDSNASTGGTTWTVCLNFDLKETGRIHSKVRLTSDTVSTHFWAEKESTVNKISGYLPRLKKALESIGLNINHMTSSLGTPPDPVEIVTSQHNLLDENA